VDIGLGLDVDADRGLVDDEDFDLRGDPFRDRDLLLVAAGQIASVWCSDGVRTSSLRIAGSTALRIVPSARKPSFAARRRQTVMPAFSRTE
jgi:hypothetical protein